MKNYGTVAFIILPNELYDYFPKMDFFINYRP
jgi:hypothetical protein